APAAHAEVEGVATQASLRSIDDDGTAELAVSFSKPPKFSARVSHEGKRLIIDVPHSRVDGAAPAIVDGKGLVLGVMVQGFEPPGQAPTTRILLTLGEKAPYSVV